MPPARYGRAQSASDLSRFTDRDDLRIGIHALTHSVTELPVVMFYGFGEAGKSWPLRKLREELPPGLPATWDTLPDVNPNSPVKRPKS